MTDLGALRVVLVDDHALFRTGVRSEIGEVINVIGEAGDVGEAVDVICAMKPDVVLLDVHLPGGDAPAVIGGVTSRGVGARYLALSVSDAAEDVIAVIRAGARGYVTKAISGDELIDAIRRVAEGDAVFSPGWPVSCSTRSPPSCPPAPTPNSTSSPPGSRR